MASASSIRFDRLLRAFADVRPGEGLTAVLLAANVFLILLAYYVLKPVREALILGQASAEIKSYLAVGQVALLIVVVPAYAKLVAAVPRLRLIRVVTWVFIGCLVAFYLLAQAGVPLGIPYFLWIGVFNLMIVAQFWAFANDIYTKEAGERLFPIVGFGASLGAVLGSFVAGLLIRPLGVYQLMLVGAGGLLLQMQVTAYVDRRESGRKRPQRTDTIESDHPAQRHNAFALVFNNRYLLGIGVMLLLFYLVDATGEYILGSLIKDRATDMVSAGQSGGLTVEGLIGRFYSRYFGLINIASLLIQLFLVSRFVKYLGVGRAVCVLPALSVVAYSIMAFVPNLSFMLAGKVSEKSTDYSLNNTVRNMLFLPCTREEKYSAKQVIDSLFVRFGDVVSATLVFVGTTALGLSSTGFAQVNIVMAAFGLLVAIAVGRMYTRLSSRPAATARPAQPTAVAAGLEPHAAT
jgi:AAA family ATP:ADP antiporter